MFETGIDARVLDAGGRRLDEFNPCPACRNASCDCPILHILRREDSLRIVERTGRGGSPENKLMCWKAWPLIGLKHIVRPAVLGGQFEIRIQYARRIIHILELGIRGTSRGAVAGDI